MSTTNTRSQPRRAPSLISDTRKEKMRLFARDANKIWRQFRRSTSGMVGLTTLVLFILIALLGPLLLHTYPIPNSQSWAEKNPTYAAPSGDFWFGTDYMGRDVFSLTILGTRASLMVGLLASLISIVLGTIVGVSSGYLGKFSDELLMRFTDFFLVIPWFPLMIVMMAILGQKFIWVVVVIGITSWPSTARIVRSQVLTVKERQFIVRSRCVGAPDSHILRTHIMPNVLPLIFANTVLLVAIAIFNEAFLDFFGLGDPTVISWGTMLEAAYENNAFVSGAWWWIIAPGAAIVIIVLAFSLVGYAIDDVLNPKLRRR